MHLSHCRSCIRIYTIAAETLERRIAEGDVANKPKDSPTQVQPETEEVPETDDSRSLSADSKSRGEDRYCI